MNYLNKLLEGAEVEWKTLGAFCDIKTGRGVTKKDSSDTGQFPIISGGKEPMGYINKYNRDANTITISRVGANSGYVNYIDEKFYLNDKCFSVIANEVFLNRIDNKYLYYFLKSIEESINNLQSDGGVPTINTSKLSELQIPIPPLEIQQKIVGILDKFTMLTAELTAELTSRIKQYEFYREQLLSFDEDEVEWKTLGEILTRTKGTSITAAQMRSMHKEDAPLKIFAGGKTIAFVNYEDIPEKDINIEPSIIVKSRGVIEFEYYDKPFSHKNEMWSYNSINTEINIKFVYYFLKINEFYFQNIGNRMQMPQISIPDTDKFKIPIPYPNNPEKSIQEQARIVAILDKFDTLTTSISEGLPKEIELRTKQYEYYRELLLSFPKGKKN